MIWKNFFLPLIDVRFVLSWPSENEYFQRLHSMVDVKWNTLLRVETKEVKNEWEVGRAHAPRKIVFAALTRLFNLNHFRLRKTT